MSNITKTTLKDKHLFAFFATLAIDTGLVGFGLVLVNFFKLLSELLENS